MLTTTLSDFRKDIKLYLDKVTMNLDTLIINRGKDVGVVIISLEEYNSLKATQHELSSKNNEKRLDSAIEKLKQNFDVAEKGSSIFKPDQLHTFGMYLEGKWYSLKAKNGTYNDQDPIGVLDVTILSDKILGPLLNIHDLRTDKRIEFVGGLRGLGELEKRVNSGEMKVAFALYPVTMKQLIDIADTGNIMPPKTTWFEPKLRSGLVVHSID